MPINKPMLTLSQFLEIANLFRNAEKASYARLDLPNSKKVVLMRYADEAYEEARYLYEEVDNLLKLKLAFSDSPDESIEEIERQEIRDSFKEFQYSLSYFVGHGMNTAMGLIKFSKLRGEYIREIRKSVEKHSVAFSANVFGPSGRGKPSVVEMPPVVGHGRETPNSPLPTSKPINRSGLRRIHPEELKVSVENKGFFKGMGLEMKRVKAMFESVLKKIHEDRPKNMPSYLVKKWALYKFKKYEQHAANLSKLRETGISDKVIHYIGKDIAHIEPIEKLGVLTYLIGIGAFIHDLVDTELTQDSIALPKTIMLNGAGIIGDYLGQEITNAIAVRMPLQEGLAALIGFGAGTLITFIGTSVIDLIFDLVTYTPINVYQPAFGNGPYAVVHKNKMPNYTIILNNYLRSLANRDSSSFFVHSAGEMTDGQPPYTRMDSHL